MAAVGGDDDDSSLPSSLLLLLRVVVVAADAQLLVAVLEAGLDGEAVGVLLLLLFSLEMLGEEEKAC